MSEVPWELDSGEFRLISKRVANNIIAMEEQGRIMRAMVSWVGFPQCSIEYDRPARLIGETKYPLTKMISLAWVGLISFSSIPLRIISFLGFLAAGLASLIGLYALFRWGVIGDTVKGWTTLIILNTGMGGLILIGLGIVGEYISRIYIEIKRRPHFIIERETKNG
jgi:dolichol-phosphate mannosyltransferase